MTLLVFSDDWGRHPSSCQYLIRELLPRTQVLWVNTIGMRRIKPDLATIRRGAEKLTQWFGPKPPSAVLPSNLRVVSPVMWPGFANRFERGLNRRLLVRQLRSAIAQLSEPPIAVTTIPTVADLVGQLEVKKWVYYCVDDFTSWPGLDGHAIDRLENQLITDVDAIVAVSETLLERVARVGKTATLLTHGVDLGFWRVAPSSEAPQEFAGVPRPWLLFWGLLDRRMDVEILRQLSDRKIGSVVLVGPEDHSDPAISTLPGMFRRPAVPLDRLPQLAAAADVLVMPYADLPVTRAIQPLKLKEYLATGRPVVVRDLPANRDWADALDLANNPTAFAEAVARRLIAGPDPVQAGARTRLSQESWAAKAADFAQMIGLR